MVKGSKKYFIYALAISASIAISRLFFTRNITGDYDPLKEFVWTIVLTAVYFGVGFVGFRLTRLTNNLYYKEWAANQRINAMYFLVVLLMMYILVLLFTYIKTDYPPLKHFIALTSLVFSAILEHETQEDYMV